MTDQLDKIFHIDHKDKLQYFQMDEVKLDRGNKHIHLKIIGFSPESQELTEKIFDYLKKHLSSAALTFDYEQIKDIDILLGKMDLFLKNVKHNANNCSKQVNTLKISNRNGVLHTKYHWDITAEQEKSLKEAVFYIAQRVNSESSFEKAAKTVPTTTAAQSNAKSKKEDSNGCLLGRDTKAAECCIEELNENSGNVTVKGYISRLELRNLKDNVSQVLSIDVTDYVGSITCEKYLNEAKKHQKKYKFIGDLKEGQYIRIQGQCEYNKYKRENTVKIQSIALLDEQKAIDDAEKKRIELHLHTKMSTMDGLVDVKELIDLASRYGHRAVGITDHGTVQSFPDAHIAASKKGIKVLYGVEAYLFDDTATALTGKTDMKFDGSFVVFDVETTGLYSDTDVIIEIGAVKIKNGEITDTFSSLVNPKRIIPKEIQKLTGISNSMVAQSPDEGQVIGEFAEFAKGCVLAAHNADFDMGFLNNALKRIGSSAEFAYIDTIETAKRLMPEKRIFKLDKLCKDLNIRLMSHHRAKDDAEATAKMLLHMFGMLKERGIERVDKIDSIKNKNIQQRNIYHAVIYAKNQAGLKNLYKLISIGNLEYLFRGNPHIPKTILAELRDGLILGSACEAGELFRGMVHGKSEEELLKIASFYDYLEIMPIGNNKFMIADKKIKRVQGTGDLINLNKKVIEIGRKSNKIVAATGDVHFLHSRDSIFRSILMYSKDFEDADNQPPLYYRSTQEMLDEFNYLDENTAREVVVEAPNKICDMIEDIEPLPKEQLYAPKMENAEEQIVEMSYKTAREIYGENLPEIVQQRLKKEHD